MRGCFVVSGWLSLLLLVIGTGSCAVCAVLYLPQAERMVGCIDCAVLEVGDPDAKEWSSLEAGTEYVLVGCSTFRRTRWQVSNGLLLAMPGSTQPALLTRLR